MKIRIKVNFKMTCVGLILKKDDKFILCRKDNGQYSFPKGSAETKKDNTALDTAIREFVEETRLSGFEIVYVPFPVTEYTEKGTISCQYFYTIITNSEVEFFYEKRNPLEEIKEVDWFTVEEIRSIPDEFFYQRRKDLVINFPQDLSLFTGGTRIMSSRLRTNISKQLTYYLRHHLDEFRTASSDGYVDIDELIPKLDKPVTQDELSQIQALCNKTRIKLNGNRIRANQGHSTGDIDEIQIFEEILRPMTGCYHKTDRKLYSKIRETGLNRMGRKHIHFARDSHLLKKGKSLTIEVNMEDAMADGIKFYRSDNNVILSPGIDGVIPPKYLIFH